MSLTNEDLQAISQLLQPIKEELSEAKKDVSGIKEELSEVKKDVSGIKEELSEVKKDLHEVKQKVTGIELTIENEISVNIMRVAEGHLDISRNISEVKKTVELLDGKMEMNDIYIRHHDIEIKKLKAL